LNHFLGLVLLSVCIATAFSLLNEETAKGRVHYFLRLIVYMVFGSLLFSWLMYLIP
jgi:hypothetical protein